MFILTSSHLTLNFRMKADRCDAHKQEGSLDYMTINAVNTLWGSDVIIKVGMRHPQMQPPEANAFLPKLSGESSVETQRCGP